MLGSIFGSAAFHHDVRLVSVSQLGTSLNPDDVLCPYPDLIPRMRLTILAVSMLRLNFIYLVFVSCVLGQLHPEGPSQYQVLPSLREQARILDRWRQERLDTIPNLLREHGVDAWLVRNYLCDLIPWALLTYPRVIIF